MSHPVFLAKVSDGEIIMDDGGKLLVYRAGELDDWVEKLEGREVEVQITPLIPRHSDRARGYFFGVVIKEGAKKLGYTTEDLYATLKAELAIDRTGPLPRIKSITEMGTKEFYDFTEECRRLLAENGCDTPDPDPEWWRK